MVSTPPAASPRRIANSPEAFQGVGFHFRLGEPGEAPQATGASEVKPEGTP